MPPVKKEKTKPAKSVEVEETPAVVSGQLKKKIRKQQKRNAKLNRGVVFIKHLPHGFFENQLQNYFEQFGTVTRLRLARSRTTGGSKGYAFVEFEFPEVAAVAAETMDNYLMFNKVVKAAYIPPEKQTFNFFKSSVRKVHNKAGKPIYVSKKTAAINRRVKKFNDWTEEAYQKRTISKLKKIDKLNKKYSHLGIDFNNILVGSKKFDEQQSKDTEVNSEAGSSNNNAETKTGKRKSQKTEQQTKKAKKVSENDTESENETSTSATELEKSMHLEDLLGNTINDDSDDEEWERNSNGTNEEEEEDDDSSSNENESDEDDYDIEFNKPQQVAKKPKANNGKVNSLDKKIQHKKHVGGVQKASKALPPKAKISKAKNVMQAAMVKQLAQPIKSLKKKPKGGKK